MTIKELKKELRKTQDFICLDFKSYLIALQVAIEMGFKCNAKIIKSFE